ncbi:VP6 [Eriocheir sinensis reovirus]|uniref:VP6 n=1 Tax=Eriocheir sinensis reovirus TaxID=273810 RepID=A0A0E3T6N2_ESRV|nr:VP6 [Eriocheir sinensis reovirus]AKC01925.1 VP6 [Eriocheir sinensis reovirus]
MAFRTRIALRGPDDLVGKGVLRRQDYGTTSQINEGLTVFDSDGFELAAKLDQTARTANLTRQGLNTAISDIDSEIEHLAENLYSTEGEISETEKNVIRTARMVGHFERAVRQDISVINKNIKNNTDRIGEVRGDLIALVESVRNNTVQDIITTTAQIAENIGLATGITGAMLPFNFVTSATADATTAVTIATDTASLANSSYNLVQLQKILKHEASLRELIPIFAKAIVSGKTAEEITQIISRVADHKVSKVSTTIHDMVKGVERHSMNLWVDKRKLNGGLTSGIFEQFKDYGLFIVEAMQGILRLRVYIDISSNTKPYVVAELRNKGDIVDDLSEDFVAFPRDTLTDLETMYHRFSALGDYMKKVMNVDIISMQKQIVAILLGEKDTSMGQIAELTEDLQQLESRNLAVVDTYASHLASTSEFDQHPAVGSVVTTFQGMGQHDELIYPPKGVHESWNLLITVQRQLSGHAYMGVGRLVQRLDGPTSYTLRIHHGPVRITARDVDATLTALPDSGRTIHSHPYAHHMKTAAAMTDDTPRFQDTDLGKRVTTLTKGLGRAAVDEILARLHQPHPPVGTQDDRYGAVDFLSAVGKRVIKSYQVSGTVND